jgi:hypothetical protein
MQYLSKQVRREKKTKFLCKKYCGNKHEITRDYQTFRITCGTCILKTYCWAQPRVPDYEVVYQSLFGGAMDKIDF